MSSLSSLQDQINNITYISSIRFHQGHINKAI